jgi:hypothetical protein
MFKGNMLSAEVNEDLTFVKCSWFEGKICVKGNTIELTCERERFVTYFGILPFEKEKGLIHLICYSASKKGSEIFRVKMKNNAPYIFCMEKHFGVTDEAWQPSAKYPVQIYDEHLEIRVGDDVFTTNPDEGKKGKLVVSSTDFLLYINDEEISAEELKHRARQMEYEKSLAEKAAEYQKENKTLVGRVEELEKQLAEANDDLEESSELITKLRKENRAILERISKLLSTKVGSRKISILKTLDYIRRVKD